MEKRSEKGWKKEFSFLFIFNWVSSVCTFNITLREPERKTMESWHLPPSQELESHLMALFWVLSEVVGLLRRLDPIPYLVKRQDAAVAQTIFYRVAGLKSLANHWLRSYHTHKVWCGVRTRAWLSVVRPRSGLLTTLIVSLSRCVKVDTLGTPCEENLDRAYNLFEQFYLNYHAKFLYSLFNAFILDSSPQTL